MSRTRNAFLPLLAVAISIVQGCTGDVTEPNLSSSAPQLNDIPEVRLEVTKTGTGYWRRETRYDWDVTKTVSPTNGVINKGSSATFTFTVNATRTSVGTVDAFGVSGEICVTNVGGAPTEGLSITDIFLVDNSIPIAETEIDVSAKPVLGPGERYCYPYTFPLPGFTPQTISYKNLAVAYTVLSNGKRIDWPGSTTVTFPTQPTLVEVDESATAVDVVTCPTGFTCTPLGAMWTLTGTATKTVPVQVTNVSAPCGTEVDLLNKVTLTESDSGAAHQAEATAYIDTQECAPPVGFQGCTPGYWKQTQHFGSWVGFAPTDKFNTVFGVNLFSSSFTLLDALKQGGGKQNRLGRHAVAALLNSMNPSVNYGPTSAQVIALVQQAVATKNYDGAGGYFEGLNERGCPLGRNP